MFSLREDAAHATCNAVALMHGSSVSAVLLQEEANDQLIPRSSAVYDYIPGRGNMDSRVGSRASFNLGL